MTTGKKDSTSLRRLLFFGLVFIGLTALGIAVVYSQFAGRSFSFDGRLVQPGALLSIALMLIVYFASDGLRLHYTLRALGYRLPLPVIFRLVFVNLFFSNITPMATGGGFAQVWYLQRHGVPLGRAMAATTIRTVLATLFIFLLTPFFLLSLEPLQTGAIPGKAGMALMLFVLLHLAFFVIVLLHISWLIQPLRRLLHGLRRLHLISAQRHRRWQAGVRREILQYSLGFGAYQRGEKRWVLLSIFFTMLFLLSLFSFPALLMHILGYETDYLATLGYLVVTTFIIYFAPTPGAAGISEGVFGSLFQGVLSGSHLVLVTLAWRLLTIHLGMLIGFVLLHKDLAAQHHQTK